MLRHEEQEPDASRATTATAGAVALTFTSPLNGQQLLSWTIGQYVSNEWEKMRSRGQESEVSFCLKMQFDGQSTVPAHFQKQNKQHRGLLGSSVHAGHMGSHKAGNIGGWTRQ